MLPSSDILRVALVGSGATVVMDVWLLFLQRIGVPTTNFALVGRWIGHVFQGRFVHASIAASAPLPSERALGWLTHYLVGIAYAALLVAVKGVEWLHRPEWMPALAIGLVTVVVPLFIMQPAMGAGIAGSRTPAPLKNFLRSIANHAVFGAGLFLAAACISWVAR